MGQLSQKIKKCLLFILSRKRERKTSRMDTGKQLAILLSTIVTLLALADGFPDGAPVDACVKDRPNQPYHGEARPQPLGSNPYAIIASTDRFEPGSKITGMFNLLSKIKEPH